MTKKTATIIGSSGMIGTLLTSHLLQDPFYDYVRILVRKPAARSHEKLEVKLVNFDHTEWLKLALEDSYAVFSCIGTTNKNVKGDKELYWKIDHDLPVKVCRMAKDNGCEKFLIVSSVGANPASSNFYLRLKGATEQDVIATGISQVHIMRPGQLLGARKENRPLERWSQSLMKPLSQLMTGSMEKFKAIEGNDVARAMVTASIKEAMGVHVYTYNEIMALSAAMK